MRYLIRIALVAGAVALWGLATPLLAQDDDPDLLHYWSFNTSEEEGNPWPAPVDADLGSGALTYMFDPGSLDDFGGTTVNARLEESSGESFTMKGSAQNGLYFELAVPTSGFEDILLRYAQRGTGTGFSTHEIQYSTNGGTSFEPIETFTGRNATGSSFDLLEVDFGGLGMVDDNPDFVIRVTVDGATSGSGNNRFDNITIEGVAIEAVEEGPIANVTQGTFHDTLTDAITSAQAGDSLTVSSGTYAESITIDKPLILQGLASEDVLLALSSYTLTSSASGAPEGAPVIAGLVTLAADAITLRGLTVDGGSGSAVLTQPANVGYDGLTLEENTFTADSGGPLVYIHGGFAGGTLTDPSTNVTIAENIFTGSLGPGVALGLEAISGTVTENVFTAATAFGHVELWGFDVDSGVAVADNTFNGDGLDDGFYVRDGTPGSLYDLPGLQDENTFDPESEIVGDEIRPAAPFECPEPSFAEDSSAISSEGIAILTITGSDGAGITDVNFVDPDTDETALVNLIASTDTPDFTASDGIRFSFGGSDDEAPLEVVFTLTVDEPEGLEPGETFTASYFAKVINACDQTIDVDPVQTLTTAPATAVQLQGNYPNPFTDATTLRFALPEATDVRLVVFDLLGREVARLVEERLPAGTHEVRWDGTLRSGHAAASGVYIVRLEAGAVHTTRRILRTR